MLDIMDKTKPVLYILIMPNQHKLIINRTKALRAKDPSEQADANGISVKFLIPDEQISLHRQDQFLHRSLLPIFQPHSLIHEYFLTIHTAAIHAKQIQ